MERVGANPAVLRASELGLPGSRGLLDMPDGAGARGAAADGGGAEQQRDCFPAGAIGAHGGFSREQRPPETGRRLPDRGGGEGEGAGDYPLTGPYL